MELVHLLARPVGTAGALGGRGTSSHRADLPDVEFWRGGGYRQCCGVGGSKARLSDLPAGHIAGRVSGFP